MSYRIPNISEFIEGFEYQVPHTYRIDIVDFSKEPSIVKEGKWNTIWVDRVVPNLDPIIYPHTIIDEEGISWTFMNPDPTEENFLERIKRMLENGQIRAKIK